MLLRRAIPSSRPPRGHSLARPAGASRGAPGRPPRAPASGTRRQDSLLRGNRRRSCSARRSRRRPVRRGSSAPGTRQRRGGSPRQQNPVRSIVEPPPSATSVPAPVEAKPRPEPFAASTSVSPARRPARAETRPAGNRARHGLDRHGAARHRRRRRAPRAHRRARALRAGPLRLRRDVNYGGCEHRSVEIARLSVRDLVVQRRTLLEERPELLRIPGERPHARGDALPRLVGRRLEEERERMLGERRPCGVNTEGPAAELDDRERPSGQDVEHRSFLELAEGILAALGEDLGDAQAGTRLDDVVDRDELAAEERRQLRSEGRLPGAHRTRPGRRGARVRSGSRLPRDSPQVRAVRGVKSCVRVATNFSRTARPSSHATADSATTARGLDGLDVAPLDQRLARFPACEVERAKGGHAASGAASSPRARPPARRW